LVENLVVKVSMLKYRGKIKVSMFGQVGKNRYRLKQMSKKGTELESGANLKHASQFYTSRQGQSPLLTPKSKYVY